MPPIQITPQRDPPLPYDDSDEVVPTLLEQMAVSGRTAEVQAALGAPIELTRADGRKAKELFEDFLADPTADALENRAVAVSAVGFLRQYGQAMALDAVRLRSAITNKLMEIANCGETKHELRALELLGKHSDIGLFTERSEITIKSQSADDLEKAIRERVQRLMQVDTLDVTPRVKGFESDDWSDETLSALKDFEPPSYDPDWNGPTRAVPPEDREPDGD